MKNIFRLISCFLEFSIVLPSSNISNNNMVNIWGVRTMARSKYLSKSENLNDNLLIICLLLLEGNCFQVHASLVFSVFSFETGRETLRMYAWKHLMRTQFSETTNFFKTKTKTGPHLKILSRPRPDLDRPGLEFRDQCPESCCTPNFCKNI